MLKSCWFTDELSVAPATSSGSECPQNERVNYCLTMSPFTILLYLEHSNFSVLPSSTNNYRTLTEGCFKSLGNNIKVLASGFDSRMTEMYKLTYSVVARYS